MIRRRGLAVCLPILILTPEMVAQTRPRLDTTTFVVLGEGLAAGMADFGLASTVQEKSFPAQMARQMGTCFPQPLMEAPGIGDVLGYPALPIRVPTYPEGRLRIFPQQSNPADEAPTLFVLNLSVPNLTLADSLALRPAAPLIHGDNPKLTSVNLILGFPALILGKAVPLWTQYEYAVAMSPTFALVELGYYEALEAAAAGDPARIPDAAAFRSAYSTIVKGLRGIQSQVLVTTVPDPTDTAYFSTVGDAAQLLGVPAADILSGRGLTSADLITRNGLAAVSNQLLRRQVAPLPPGGVVTASVAADISSRVRALNAAITNVASENGATLYDLQGYLHAIRLSGTKAGAVTVTAKYLGGFYSLDGVYPGATGHALIANDILSLLNRTYGRSFPLLDAGSIANADPAAAGKAAAQR